MPIHSFLVDISFVQIAVFISLLSLACILWEASFFILYVHLL